MLWAEGVDMQLLVEHAVAPDYIFGGSPYSAFNSLRTVIHFLQDYRVTSCLASLRS